jgi:hypothetical protein
VYNFSILKEMGLNLYVSVVKCGYVRIGFFISFAFIPYPDYMTIKPDKNKKMAVGIYLTTIFESMSLGYKDINEYIDSLKQQITKLQKANEMASQIIKELEARLKEKETAKEKEHS